MMLRAVSVRKAGLLSLLIAIGFGALFFFFLRPRPEAQVRSLSEQEREARKRQILRIASIDDGKVRVAELRDYVGQNPDGPFLNVAYGLLLESLYQSDQAAAMDLADRILARYTAPDQLDVRFPAYQLKLSVLAATGRLDQAAGLAKTVLSKEVDPSLLRFASQFDPADRQLFEAKITDLEAQERLRASRREMEELLGLPFSEWESKTVPAKTSYLETLIEDASKPAAPDSKNRKRLFSLLRAMVDHLNRSGDGAQALTYLKRFSTLDGPQDYWYFLSRAQALELTGDSAKAVQEYLRAFGTRPVESVWKRVRSLSAKLGTPISVYVGKAEEMMARSGGRFASFSLRSPSGRPMKLEDLSTRSVLVSFFFPG